MALSRIHCSAWSLLSLKENPSYNGRNQEEDGEVGGGASHQAHSGSNLSTSSEIVKNFC